MADPNVIDYVPARQKRVEGGVASRLVKLTGGLGAAFLLFAWHRSGMTDPGATDGMLFFGAIGLFFASIALLVATMHWLGTGRLR